MRIAIIIPAYNEAARIKQVVQEVTALGYAVIVVNDGSNDETTAQALDGGATVLTHKLNRGQGAALRTGIRFALDQGFDGMVQFDGDGQHRKQDISKFIQVLEQDQADVVIGSRFLTEKSNIPWTKKFFILKPALLLQQLTTGLKLTDVHNGFRAFNKKAAQTIKISQDRMAHASEIIGEISEHKLRYVEVPIQVIYHEYGQGFLSGVKILRDLIIGKFVK